MHFKAGQIFRAKRAPLGKVDYARPFIILAVNSHDVEICFFSTKFELMEPGDLTINELDADFPKTGLDETSYLILNSVKTRPFEFVNQSKYLGEAVGEIRRQVEVWWGAPLR